jgi:hypothetical protein
MIKLIFFQTNKREKNFPSLKIPLTFYLSFVPNEQMMPFFSSLGFCLLYIDRHMTITHNIQDYFSLVL